MLIWGDRPIPTLQPSMTPKLPPHVRRVIVKGRAYHYYQPHRATARAGKPVRLPDDARSPEFWQAYAAAANVAIPQVSANAVALLIDAYQRSPEWLGLAKKTRVEWQRYLDRVRERWGHLEARAIEPKHVLALRDKYASTPAAANNLLRALSSMLSWAVPRGWLNANPCDHVKKLKGGDYAPWTRREIEFFRKHARPDLWHAAALALYTGQRQADVLAMRRSSIRDNEIEVIQGKTGKKLWIPLHPELQATLAEMPKRSVFLLTTTQGTPWTTDGFKSSWQAEMDRRIFGPLRRRRRVFHGLRKSAVVFLFECGCTDAEVASITGQSRRMLEHYSREVNQRKLARAAVLKWGDADARTKNELKR